MWDRHKVKGTSYLVSTVLVVIHSSSDRAKSLITVVVIVASLSSSSSLLPNLSHLQAHHHHTGVDAAPLRTSKPLKNWGFHYLTCPPYSCITCSGPRLVSLALSLIHILKNSPLHLHYAPPKDSSWRFVLFFIVFTVIRDRLTSFLHYQQEKNSLEPGWSYVAFENNHEERLAFQNKPFPSLSLSLSNKCNKWPSYLPSII